MAFDFPSSPTLNQTFTPPGGPTYTWNGYAWTITSGPFQPLDADLTTLANLGNWKVIYSDGTSAIQPLALGPAGQVLTSNGPAAAPSFQAGGGGGGIGKQTMWIPASAMTPTITSGATPGQVATATYGMQIRSLDFDPNTAWYAQFEIAMPKSWDLGTVSFIAVWSTASATAGNVIWALQAVARTDGQSLDVSFGTAQSVTQTASGSANVRQVSAESAAITVNGAAANAGTIFQIYRDAANASDTHAANARLHGIKLFYTTNAANDA